MTDGGLNRHCIFLCSSGYMAPEYRMRGHYSVKSDVFSFGVLVLEIVTGRSNNCCSDSQRSEDLLTWVSKPLNI